MISLSRRIHDWLTVFGCALKDTHALYGIMLMWDGRYAMPDADPVFEAAVATIRATYSDETWNSMSLKAQSKVIYDEIRRIDLERHQTHQSRQR